MKRLAKPFSAKRRRAALRKLRTFGSSTMANQMVHGCSLKFVLDDHAWWFIVEDWEYGRYFASVTKFATSYIEMAPTLRRQRLFIFSEYTYIYT